MYLIISGEILWQLAPVKVSSRVPIPDSIIKVKSPIFSVNASASWLVAYQ